jgi:GxxExxY protein
MPLLYKNESYKIIGACMEVHNQLGPGFLEIVYKDALEIEFTNIGIPYAREKEYVVQYKDAILPHKFYADFVVYDCIILEVKAASTINENYQAQALNYLAVSREKLAIIVNFGEMNLNFQRLIK